MDKELNDQEDVIDELPADTEEGQEDKTDWKALAKKNQGIAKRYQTKLEKAKEEAKKVEPKKVEEPKPSKETKDDFDYAELAYLEAKGYSDSKEQALAKKAMEDTGKSLKDVLENKYFQSEIKDMRDARASTDAIPKGSKRSGHSLKKDVEYWLAKGELPPADQPKLRQAYVNAKIKKETDGDKFTSRPVVQ